MQLYQEVTNRIVRELEAGAPPWVKPWKDAKGHSLIPQNLVTARPYSGINTLILWCEAYDRGYPSHCWATFQQAKEMGANVRKGERSTIVVFVKPVRQDEEDTGYTVMRSFRVFNVAQLENVPDDYGVGIPYPEDAHPLLSVVPVIHGGNQAAYYPSRDQIVMPTKEQFVSEEAYWQTLCHELTHSTGHESRLNRQLGKRFGKDAYAAEELIAEMGGAFVTARLGIQPTLQTTAYLDHWINVLKSDVRAIFTAASQATKAADWIWKHAYETAPA